MTEVVAAAIGAIEAAGVSAAILAVGLVAVASAAAHRVDLEAADLVADHPAVLVVLLADLVAADLAVARRAVSAGEALAVDLRGEAGP